MGKSIRGWLLLASSAEDFEESVTQACEMVLKKDPRIGKIPAKQRGQAADLPSKGARKATKERRVAKQ